MDKPLISIWIITYNQEKYIKKALDSALSQKTNFKYEIVIGDDFSTDKTRDIQLEYKRKYPNIIKLLLHPKNIGMIQNQNRTFNECQGDYIALLEGDDYWNDIYKLQKQYNVMQQYPESNLSFHPVYTTKNTILTKYSDKIEIFPVSDAIRIGGYYISTPSIMIKKDVINKIPKFIENAPAGDYYIQIFGSLNGGALYIPDIMATYRIDSDGSWSQSIYNIDVKTKFIEETLEIIIQLDNYLDSEYTEDFKYRYLIATIVLVRTYLHNKDFKNFKNSLEKARPYISNISLKFWIIYKLRNFPKIVLLLSTLLYKIKNR